MHKPSFSVKGQIDMFSMLQTLLIWLSGLLDESWTLSTQFFLEDLPVFVNRVN